MAVLVTGSSGFIGRSVVQALANRGANPVAFDLVAPPEGSLPPGVPFVRGTIANIEEVMGAIVDHDVHQVVTLAYIQAALNAPDFVDYTGAARVNILGVTNVFEAARLAGVDRVVFASSVGVYGPRDLYGDRPINEDDQLSPGNLYGKMKQVNEEVARQYRKKHGLEVVVVRPVAVLGAGTTQWPERLIAEPSTGIAAQLYQREDHRTNVIAVEDVAWLFAAIATAPEVKHDCYLASGHSMSWGEVAAIVRKHVPGAQIAFDEDVPPHRASSHLCDNSRAVDEFGWQPHTLEESVVTVINDARKAVGLPSV